jgi:hypothetical protein
MHIHEQAGCQLYTVSRRVIVYINYYITTQRSVAATAVKSRRCRLRRFSYNTSLARNTPLFVVDFGRFLVRLLHTSAQQALGFPTKFRWHLALSSREGKCGDSEPPVLLCSLDWLVHFAELDWWQIQINDIYICLWIDTEWMVSNALFDSMYSTNTFHDAMRVRIINYKSSYDIYHVNDYIYHVTR